MSTSQKKHSPDVIPTPGSVQIYNLFRTLFQLLNNPAEKKFTENEKFLKKFNSPNNHSDYFFASSRSRGTYHPM